VGVDRRTFLNSVGAAAGALLTIGVAPLAAARGADPEVSAHAACAPSAAADPCVADDWHVDDICGHRPRYAHPIAHAPARSSPVLWESVDPIDRMLMI
jgi:hypothetical protein